MVEALLKWQDDTKTHFKAKVGALINMFVIWFRNDFCLC
jgi:hypothetical protein